MRKLGVLASFALVACGGSSGIDLDGGFDAPATTNDGGQQGDAVVQSDAGGEDATTVVDAGPYGAPSSTYPAFTPWMGQLSKNGGPILSAPVIVTITWDGDTGRTTFESFGDQIGGSSYWSAAVGEYGVGAATSGTTNHVHVSTTPPTQWGDTDVRKWIDANLGTLLPTPTAQTIYVVYVSNSTTFTFGNQNACNSIGGYHDSFPSTSNGVIAYAVLPSCASDSKTTQYASHEIGEAATDPQPSNSVGLFGWDDPYLAFHEWQRGNDENGDACEFFADSFYTEQTPFAFQVQRLWSNKMGAAGHSPCQPYTATYFNVAPLGIGDITVDLSQEGGPANFTTKGYVCALGATCQIPVGIYSDGATNPISVSVAESNPLVNPVTGRLTLSIDTNKTSGVNGEITYVNVTVNQKGPLNAEMLTVITTLGNTKHYLPLLVQN
jgi:hypothetical protein